MARCAALLAKPEAEIVALLAQRLCLHHLSIPSYVPAKK